jgi:predicted aspartyl protease
METITMGRVLVRARIENLADLYEVQKGARKSDDLRAVEVDNTLVDPGATLLSLPTRIIEQLGLEKTRTRRARTAAGVQEFGVCTPVRLTIQGRDCTMDVAELPDDCPVLIGQLPLEALDFVVDPVGQRLIGNPEHGGEHMIDLF